MQIARSVCKACYARRGNFVWPASTAIRNGNYRMTIGALRYPNIRKAWVATLVKLITTECDQWFRWHDSGDVLSEQHLHMIFDVCEQTPKVKHWLPTREYAIVQAVLLERRKPANCVIRLSAHMVGDVLGSKMPTSSVGAGSGFLCQATYSKEVTGGNCGSCRACWDAKVANVDYKRH